ncbi:MAG: hypothetical protein LBH13_00150 [Cellulomonadaceae bacterium]|jgi:hypothetical protein|nr:hypothetical protein [Cellulomonadaceae bacterium]
MLRIILWIVVLVILFAAVLLVARVVQNREDGEQVNESPLTALRNGLKHFRDTRDDGAMQDTTLSDYFAESSQQGTGYVDSEEVNEVMAEAHSQAREGYDHAVMGIQDAYRAVRKPRA